MLKWKERVVWHTKAERENVEKINAIDAIKLVAAFNEKEVNLDHKQWKAAKQKPLQTVA